MFLNIKYHVTAWRGVNFVNYNDQGNKGIQFTLFTAPV